MILIDLTQVLIASLMAQTRGGSEPIDEPLIRHIALKSLALYRKKYNKTYGELVLADDSHNVWRKDIYPYYKANRKKGRDSDPRDWGLIFDCITTIRQELKENLDLFLSTVPDEPKIGGAMPLNCEKSNSVTHQVSRGEWKKL